MLLTCRLYLIGRILFWLHSLFLQFYRTVVSLSCITVYICWCWPYSYFVSWWILRVCNPIRPQLFVCPQCTLIFFYQAFMSILATWLAIWFSVEFDYSSPLCGRSLATLPIVKVQLTPLFFCWTKSSYHPAYLCENIFIIAFFLIFL